MIKARLAVVALALAGGVRADPPARPFTLLDRTDVQGRFEAFGTLQTRSVSAWIYRGTSVADVSGKAEQVWWVTPPTPGVLLVDRVNGPVAYLFKLLTFGIMSVPRSGYDTSGRYVHVQGSPDESVLSSPIPAATLDFTWGPERRGGTLSGYARYIGMTLGYLQYPGWRGLSDVDTDPIDPLSRTSSARFLRSKGAYWTKSSYSAEWVAAVNARLPLDLPLLGGVTIVWDLPMVYTTMAVFGAATGGDPDEGFSDAYGFPRVHVQASRSFGPLSVGAEYVVPARWLLVPYWREGAHFTVQAGLRF